jgi:hypothetical protein
MMKTASSPSFKVIQAQIVFGALEVLKEFINEYYHIARPHHGLDGERPFPPISLRQSQNRPGLFPFPLWAAYITVTCGWQHNLLSVCPITITSRRESISIEGQCLRDVLVHPPLQYRNADQGIRGFKVFRVDSDLTNHSTGVRL